MAEGFGSAVHHGVQCDECKTAPIVGPRFKSKKISNYDLCQSCFQGAASTASSDEYTRIDHPRDQDELAAVLQKEVDITVMDELCWYDDEGHSVQAEWLLNILLQSRVLSSFTAEYSRQFGTKESCKLLGELLRTSTTLENLSLHGVAMDGDSFEYIVKALLDNPDSVLERLEVGSNVNLRAKGAELVTQLLRRELPKLTTLGIWGPGFTPEETAPVAQALALNTTIKSLSVGSGYGITYPEGDGPLNHFLRALTPVDRLTADQASYQEGRHNVTVRGLSLCYEYEKDLVTHITRMLRGNTSLARLGLRYALFSHEEWKEILDSLKLNQHIHDLDLFHCGAGFGHAFEDLMKLLQANSTIKRIELGSTALEADGRASQVQAMLARNQRLSEYLDTLNKNLKFVRPSIGRVFLCGSPRAGKTTLRKSMVRSQEGSWGEIKRFVEKYWCGSRFSERTQGIEIRMLKASADKHIAIWDMAGQEEYHALHDSHYLFPDINQACMFLFLYRPHHDDEAKILPTSIDALKSLEKQLHYWLSFVNSNSKKTGWVLPTVSVVLTHFDKLFSAKWFSKPEKYVAWASDVVAKLRDDFRGRVEVRDKIHAIDALSVQDAQNVVNDVMVCFDDLFENTLPKVPAACDEMNLVLSKWSVQHPFEPIISSDTFLELCRENVAELKTLFQSVPRDLPAEAQETNLLKNQRAVKYYLHDVGSVISFEESDCIVVDPNWLGQVFLGELFRPKDASHFQALFLTETGIVDGHVLETYLEEFISSRRYRGFAVTDLIKLMEELELCYESTSEHMGGKRYFIPIALADPFTQARYGKRQLHWTIQKRATPRHRGIRLQSTDQSRTFLSPGVFQRFQVRLQQFLSRERIDKYEIKYNLIVVKYDGMEMFVESSGEGGDYVDVLVRSYVSERPGSEKLFTDVVQEFRSFCASRRGSPGVALQEAILRPECVENLTLCAHRKNQAVLKESLKDRVAQKLLTEPVEDVDIWADDAYASIVTDDFLSRMEHHQLFPAVPEAKLDEAWVSAMDMLTLLDVREAIFKNRLSVSQQAYAIYQAVDELVVNKVVPASSQETATTSAFAEITARMPVDRPYEDDQQGWQVYLNDMERRMHDDLEKKIRSVQVQIQRTEDNVLNAVREQTHLLHQLIEKSMEDLQMLHRNTQIALIQKLDQVLCATDAVHGIPKIPYFTDTGVGLPQRIVSFIKFGDPLKLHFMCEEPSKVHYVREQKGLPVLNLYEGKVYERLRPIVSVSMKLLFILVKAGLHVGAGIGNAIPDFSSMDGAMSLMAVSLTGESLLNEVKKVSHIEATGDIQDAWQCVQELVGPLARQGKIMEHFQLYQVRYKSNYLTKYLSRDRTYWVCGSCRRKAEKANQLDEGFNSLDRKHTPSKMVHKEDML